ncbi:hypothetical protein B9Z55_025973 [Caenorhabditis nigoni]|uniref:Uncharacterized protein n=1 Tax=Caenorhabditis nigoni TaxID=1611254 RepID=A0A2G5T171_9PELO|nr:hypothetical protein B9Z55_025973 [Caenorhabditis nigoni]
MPVTPETFGSAQGSSQGPAHLAAMVGGSAPGASLGSQEQLLVPFPVNKALDEVDHLRNQLDAYARELWRTQGEVNGLNAQHVHDNQLITQLNRQQQNQQRECGLSTTNTYKIQITDITYELLAARQEIKRLQLEVQRLRSQERVAQASQLESLKQELEDEKKSHGARMQIFMNGMTSSYNEIEELKAKNKELEERLARAEGAAGADGK